MNAPLLNLNGTINSKENSVLSLDHRALIAGEIILEKIRLLNGEFLFKEKHYFHLMANMRMARIQIPIHWTPDFFYSELERLKVATSATNAVFNFYASENYNEVDYWITANILPSDFLFLSDYEIDLYRESHVANGWHQRIHFVAPHNKILKKYSVENDLQNLILLNESKSIAQSIEGNIFVIKDKIISTPRLDNGSLDDVLRDVIISASKRSPYFDDVIEEQIFPFKLTQADEIFIAQNGLGIFSVSNFRKSIYSSDLTQELFEFVLEFA